MKFLKNKGFTLAEMLIVMAVVVILAAAAAPAIGSQAEAARESNDLSAIREGFIEAYTQAAVAYNATGKLGTNGTMNVSLTVPITQTVAGWGTTPVVGGVTLNVADSSGAFEPTASSVANKQLVYAFEGDATATGEDKVPFAFVGVTVATG